MLFVSPNSLESLFCHREIQHALKHNKRIIPCLYKPIDQPAMFKAWQNNPDLCKYEQLAHENWDYIQKIQWIDFTLIRDVNQAIDALLATVDTDPERVKLHTRLLLRLRDWESRGRNPSGLLRGDELTHYEQWFTESRQKGTQLERIWEFKPTAKLIVPLPLPVNEYSKDFVGNVSRQEFFHWLNLAVEVTMLPEPSVREEGYLAAGLYVLDHCDMLIALWDGLEVQGLGGTGNIVALARERRIRLAWVYSRRLIQKGIKGIQPSQEPGTISFERFDG